MRCAMTRVLPEPGPARISSGPCVCSTASRWRPLRFSRIWETGVVTSKLYKCSDTRRTLAVGYPQTSPLRRDFALGQCSDDTPKHFLEVGCLNRTKPAVADKV